MEVIWRWNSIDIDKLNQDHLKILKYSNKTFE